MTLHRAALIAERLRLLEIEAEVQRASLVATLATFEDRRTLVWGTSLATMIGRLLAIPRIRWLVVATLLARLKPRMGR